MTCHSKKTMVLPVRAMMIVISFTFLLGATIGCTTFSTMTNATREVIADIKSNHQNMKKRMGVANFGYKTFTSGSSLEELFQNSLIKEIRSTCTDMILTTPDETGTNHVLTAVPRLASGEINNYQLVMEGRQLGLNSIITGAPLDISEEVEEEGLLWFKDTHSYARIRIPIDVYDTATGAKLLGKIFIRKIKMDANELSRLKSKGFENNAAVMEAIADMSEEAAEMICDVVSIQQWKGYVTAVDENQVTISSGSEAGLQPGDIMEVYDGQNTINGIEDQVFFLLGDKIGEIKISSVNAYQSKAILISGTDIPVSSLVLHKE